MTIIPSSCVAFFTLVNTPALSSSGLPFPSSLSNHVNYTSVEAAGALLCGKRPTPIMTFRLSLSVSFTISTIFFFSRTKKTRRALIPPVLYWRLNAQNVLHCSLAVANESRDRRLFVLRQVRVLFSSELHAGQAGNKRLGGATQPMQVSHSNTGGPAGRSLGQVSTAS